MHNPGCERWDSNPRFSPYEGDEIAASLLRNGCGGQIRTANLYLMRVVSYHFSTPRYIRGNVFSVGAPATAHERKWKPHQRLVPMGGIEPPTYDLWGHRSDQLSYTGISRKFCAEFSLKGFLVYPSEPKVHQCALMLATPRGLEPLTSGVTGRRSNQLNYEAI